MIPLDCGVFGVSSDEYLWNAINNSHGRNESSRKFGRNSVFFRNKSLDKRKYLHKIRILLANYPNTIVMVTSKNEKKKCPSGSRQYS
jgi:hypothetical protein